MGLPPRAWREAAWRAGGRAELTSRFAARRVRPAHRDTWRAEPRPEEWLPAEWPEGAAEPGKCWLSDLPPRTAPKALVQAAKARRRIERDHQELEQEIGLGHDEGRGWRGFHHHASLRVAAHGFLVAEPCRFPLGPASPAGGSRRLRRPEASGRAAPPVRPERHVPHSVAPTRRRLALALAGRLPRRPCRTQDPSRSRRRMTQ